MRGRLSCSLLMALAFGLVQAQERLPLWRPSPSQILAAQTSDQIILADTMDAWYCYGVYRPPVWHARYPSVEEMGLPAWKQAFWDASAFSAPERRRHSCSRSAATCCFQVSISVSKPLSEDTVRLALITCILGSGRLRKTNLVSNCWHADGNAATGGTTVGGYPAAEDSSSCPDIHWVWLSLPPVSISNDRFEENKERLWHLNWDGNMPVL